MAPTSKFSSPTIKLTISEEQRTRAIASNSGGCLIADGLRTQHPRFTNIVVDMATVRVTDRKLGLRYTYLQTGGGQLCLLAFDQGWPNPVSEITYKKAVKIVPVTRAKTGPTSSGEIARRRQERLAELTARQEAGESLSSGEKIALTRMRNAKPAPERPSSVGPTEIRVREGGSNHGAVIRGGNPLLQGPPHPNLLRGRGRDRHFGAKLADPGIAFREAVDEAVRQHEALRQSQSSEPDVRVGGEGADSGS